MSVKSDKWIRRMSLEHKMIEPFEDRQVRDGVISYGVSSYGYDMRVADEFRIFTNVNSTIVDPKHFDAKSFVEFQGPVCIVPPNSFALGALGRIFPHSAQRADDLRRQIHLRALRHHRQRHAVRARVGRLRHARNQQHHAASRENLRQRRPLPGGFLRIRRAVRSFLQGQKRKVPVAARNRPAEDLDRLFVQSEISSV